MITTRQRRTEVVVTVLAGSVALGLWLLPPTPYLALPLRPWTLGLAGLWLGYRLVRLEYTLRQWRAWSTNVPWTVSCAWLEHHNG